MMLPIKYENRVYTSGIDSEYLKLNSRVKKVLSPFLLDPSDTEFKNIGLLKPYKLGDFELQLPLGNPIIKIRPLIKLVGKKLVYGLNFYDYSEGKVLSITYNGKKKFTLPKLNDKLFELTIAKDILFEKSKTQIYKDLFNLNIEPQEENFYKFLLNPRLNLKRPIYNFFILKHRLNYGISESSYYLQERNIYGTRIDDTNLSSELIEIYKNGVVYFLRIEYTGWRGMGKALRNLILNSISKVEVEEAYITEIYNNFLRNTFEDRSKDKNILQLFSAWSLNFSDKRFLKALIQTIERSKNYSSELLNSLYIYARYVHGETFSSRDDITKKWDSADAKIKKGSLEETDSLNNEIESYQIDFEKIKSGKDYLEKNINIKKDEIIDL